MTATMQQLLNELWRAMNVTTLFVPLFVLKGVRKFHKYKGHRKPKTRRERLKKCTFMCKHGKGKAS